MFINPTEDPVVLSLEPRKYLDLDQTPVAISVTLAPFSSRVLIDDGPSNNIFADGFESGDPSAWSNVVQ